MAVKITFRTGRQQFYHSPEFAISPLQRVIVNLEYGYDIATVVSVGEEFLVEEEYKKILRVADEKDLAKLHALKDEEKKAEEIYNKTITHHSIEMNLFYGVQQFDGKKMLFLFTSDGRVDFREFAKELATIFGKRIEFIQISSRDRTKNMGGIGSCGRAYCCHGHLQKFQPISVKMVKQQNLSGNLSQISGPCGRLLCCLDYEKDIYQSYPKIGSKVRYKGENYFITFNDISKEKVHLIGVKDGQEPLELPLETVKNIVGKIEE